MNWFFPAILACFSWGIGQIFIKRGLSFVSPFVSNIFFVISSFVIMFPFALFHGINFILPSIFILGFLSSLPNLIMPYVLEKGNVSLSGTILATYPIVTVILSVLFLGESLAIFGWVGVFLAVFGTFLIGKPKGFKMKLESWLAWGLLGCLMVGVGDFISKIAVTKFDLYSFLIAYIFGNFLSLGFTSLIDKGVKHIEKFSSGVIICFVGCFMNQLGLLFFYTAINIGQISQVSPVVSVYPVITAILAYLYLKEKINKQQALGIISATLGVVLISF